MAMYMVGRGRWRN